MMQILLLICRYASHMLVSPAMAKAAAESGMEAPDEYTCTIGDFKCARAASCALLELQNSILAPPVSREFLHTLVWKVPLLNS
jgi:hypothetical protein